MTTTNTPATTTQSPPKTFREMITTDNYKNQLAAALPKGLTAERMVRVVLTAINRTPKLLECTKESLWESVLNAAALGLFPDALGRAYLVPYGKKCQLIIGYKGLIDLAYRSDRIASIQAVVVREGDHFEREPLAMPPIKHRIIDAEGNPFRKATYFYSVVYLKACEFPSVEVMSLREVQDIRDRSKAATDGPWITDFEEMAKKTVLRRHMKVLPMSAEIAQAIAQEDEHFDLAAAAAIPVDGRFSEDKKPDEKPADGAQS